MGLAHLLREIKRVGADTIQIGKLTLTAPQVAEFERHYRDTIDRGYRANLLPSLAPDTPQKQAPTRRNLVRNLLDRLRQH